MILVDTSVWSLALRRDRPPDAREVTILEDAITRGESVLMIGAILQEVLQGFFVEKRFKDLEKRLRAFPLIELARADYVFAAEIRSRCRSKGVQVTTIDAQIASACIANDCALLTTDVDFRHIASHFPLQLA